MNRMSWRRTRRVPRASSLWNGRSSQIRANEAAARLLWPNGDTGLGKRIGRIICDTLIVWGAEDKVVPEVHRSLYKQGPSGRVTERLLEGAGHQADFDRPYHLAGVIEDFLG